MSIYAINPFNLPQKQNILNAKILTLLNSILNELLSYVQGDRVPRAHEHARVHGGRVLPRHAPGRRARALHTGGRDERRRARAHLRARYRYYYC